MRRPLWWQSSILVLLAAMAAGAQVPASNQGGQTAAPVPGDATIPADSIAASMSPRKPEVTVTGKAPPAERPLPKLPADQFMDCMKQGINVWLCQQQLNGDKHRVLEACINRAGNTAPPRVVQACTELMKRNVTEHWLWSYLLANRAEGYLAQGDKRNALDDYNEAVKLAPHNAELYYNRGVFHAAQSDKAAALRDFDKAISLNRKLVSALRQRAKIYQDRGDLSLARSDYSEAIGVQPKAAPLWSERGYLCLRQHDYEGAMRDETQAIQLDPRLGRAYFLRGIAFGDLGDPRNAVSDIKAAVSLDPSLAGYVMIKGKTASLALPPF